MFVVFLVLFLRESLTLKQKKLDQSFTLCEYFSDDEVQLCVRNNNFIDPRGLSNNVIR